jgi:hypothetical protein
MDWVDEIHVRNADMAEAIDLYLGHQKTELSGMLQHISKSGWQGDVVIEIPMKDLLKVARISSPIVGPSTIARLYRQLLCNTRAILEG